MLITIIAKIIPIVKLTVDAKLKCLAIRECSLALLKLPASRLRFDVTELYRDGKLHIKLENSENSKFKFQHGNLDVSQKKVENLPCAKIRK